MNEPAEQIFQGIAASSGYVIGRVSFLRQDENFYVEPADVPLPEAAVEAELELFQGALDAARAEILQLKQELQTKADARDAGIFDAQLLITDDRMLTREVVTMIRDLHKKADFAFFKVVERYVAALSMVPDSYIKERTADIRDVAARVLSHLQQRRGSGLQFEEQRILFAHNLTPSDTATFDRGKILGFVVETGSSSSHTAVLARSLQLPAVVGVAPELFECIQDGDLVVLDGYTGRVIVHPTRETEAFYRRRSEETLIFIHQLDSEKRLSAETRDGFQVQLSGNIEKSADVENVRAHGGCGVGLFRTEYLFMNSDGLPDEEKQYAIYRETLELLGKEQAVVRTLDIGGDKLEQTLMRYTEPNPFLGLRGIRFCLRERPDILRTQLRALLRAGVHGNLKVMLPMVTCVEEVQEVRALMETCRAELTAEHCPCAERLPLGAMIETPAAALCASALAKNVDFFSIGTNDLVQYTLAVDRSNERLAYLYQPTHPAVLTLIERCVTAARQHNIWVSVCGQIAGDPHFTPLLVGLGVHELSMPPTMIGPVRRVVRNLRMSQAVLGVQKALASKSSEAALQIAQELLQEAAPEIAELLDPDAMRNAPQSS